MCRRYHTFLFAILALAHTMTAIHVSEELYTQVMERLQKDAQIRESAEWQSVPSELAAEHFPILHEALEALDDAYEGCAADPMCGRLGETQSPETRSAETYGELLPTTVAHMLALAGARPGQRYYDLGSGTGKTVYLAGLLGLNATGVELVPDRTRAACAALGRPVKTGHVEKGSMTFVTGDFLDVDFSDADVLFTDSVMFSDDLKEGLASIAGRMKPGAKVVSFAGLPGPAFSAQKETFVGPTTWSPSTKWTIQTVDSSGAGTRHRVAGSPGNAPGVVCRSGDQLAGL